MINQKVLSNIEPFNEIFYRNCFYNSLFPVIKHFKKDILPVIINDIVVYKNRSIDGKSIFGSDYSSNKSTYDLLSEIGIILESSTFKPSLINNITNSILQEKPVIIWVDCFFETLREDSYKKNHWPHSLLIYGYNHNENNMNIIEHKHHENLSYDHRIISYGDIINSYEGYHHMFDNTKHTHSYYEFALSQDEYFVNKSDYIKIYINNIKAKENQIIEGLNNLKKFINYIRDVILTQTELNRVLDDIILSNNSIINAKLAEIYKLSKLFNDESYLIRPLKISVENWMEARAVILRYKYSGKYNYEILNSTINKLNCDYDYEYSYYRNMKNYV